MLQLWSVDIGISLPFLYQFITPFRSCGLRGQEETPISFADDTVITFSSRSLQLSLKERAKTFYKNLPMFLNIMSTYN